MLTKACQHVMHERTSKKLMQTSATTLLIDQPGWQRYAGGGQETLCLLPFGMHRLTGLGMMHASKLLVEDVPQQHCKNAVLCGPTPTHKHATALPDSRTCPPASPGLLPARSGVCSLPLLHAAAVWLLSATQQC